MTRTRAAILGTVLLIGGCMMVQAISSNTPPIYLTLPASKGVVTATLTATGTLNPETVVQVGSYVSGVVKSVDCDYNTVVKKGQVCARLDDRPYLSALEQDQARLATARAQLAKDRTNLEFSARAAERNSGLVKRNIVSQEVADQFQNAFQQARAQVALSEAMEHQYEAALRASKINADYTTIASPVDGVVISRSVSPGQTVNATFQTPTLFLVATDLSRMQINTSVSESDIASVKAGTPAYFTVSSIPNATLPGQVTQVRNAPQSVQGIVTYDVVVQVDNRTMQLKPGMTAVVHIVTQRRENVLRVPSAALRYLHDAAPPSGEAPLATPPLASSIDAGAGRAGEIWVLRDNKPMRVKVRTGLDDDSVTELVDAGGLHEGDAVIFGVQSAGGHAAIP